MGEEKEQLIREAINKGISPKSIYDTLYSMYRESDLSKYTKRQIKLVIKYICDMKTNTISNLNSNYVSQLVSSNYEKIIESLNNGISKEEVANMLIGAVKDNKISAADFKFLVSMIANLKKKDLRYIYKSNKTYQKIIDN